MQLPDPDECLARYASECFVTDGSPTNMHILWICQARLGPGAHSTNPNVSGYTIQIATHGVLHDTVLGLDPALWSLTQESDCHTTSFWVPGSILRSALPKLVKYFKGKKVVPPVENYPPVWFSSTSLYKLKVHRFSPLCWNCHRLTVNFSLIMPLSLPG